jgi:magnesium-transporting ATPase (P-type)
VVFIGLVMAIATLFAIDVVLPAGLVDGTGTLAKAQTTAFTVLVLAQLFNAMNSRSPRASAFRDPLSNPRLVGAIGLSLVLQVLVVHLPFLNAAFGTVPLGSGEWAMCIALASAVLWAEEAKKLVGRLRGGQEVGGA